MWKVAKPFVLVLAVVVAACDTAPSEPGARRISGRHVVTEWPRLPADAVLGRVLDVAVDDEGRVFVAHTADREAKNSEPIALPTIFVVDAESGELLAKWGAGLFRYPHGLAVDGRNRLWVTDSEANRVFRLDESGKVEEVLGD